MTPTNAPGAMVPWLEDAWLGRYLDHLLSEDEVAWFEQYVLDKPRLLALLDADTQLRRTIDSAGREYVMDGGQPTDAPEESDDTGEARPRGWAAAQRRNAPPSQRRALRWMALAAVLLAGVGLGRLTLRPDPSAPLIANPTRVVYDTLRGAATPPRIERVGDRSEYVLIEVSVPPGARDVKVHLADGSTAQLAPTADGFVRFLLLTAQLASSGSARVNYTLDGQSQSRSLSFDELQKER